MPADVKVSKIPNSKKLVFSNTYPDEPKANKTDTLALAKNGRRFANEMVKSKTVLPNGNTEIVTEYAGKDGNDNKPAIIRHTYIMGRSIFAKRKDVMFEGENGWLKRHEYNYFRK